jgi:hypothetical protein
MQFRSRGFPQDLIEGKLLNREKIRIVLDEDLEVSRLYPLTDENDVRYQDSIAFISDPRTFLFANRTNGLYKVRANDWSSVWLWAYDFIIHQWVGVFLIYIIHLIISLIRYIQI